jgi:cytoskeleton protein RodZ
VEETPVTLAPDRAPAATEAGTRRITPFGEDLIRFTFNDECWVEVKTLGGENLYSDLNRAGRTLMLQGRGPFRILLGYAPGVELEFNGEPVPLARYTRNNVASLVLGE